MVTRASNRANGKLWRARRRREGTEYLIGYFESKEDAEEAERGFDDIWPAGHPTKGKKRVQRSDGRMMYV